MQKDDKMSKDTIYRQAAIEAVGSMLRRKFGIGGDLAEITLAALPSAQSEIIRCKDCLMHGVCRFEQGLGLDGYCSQAERRTDERLD